MLPVSCSGGRTLCPPFTPALLCLSQASFLTALSPIIFFSEAVNLSVNSARISVREVSLGGLQKRKWRVEHYLMWNVVECLCWASLRGLRLQLPEKADKSCRHSVIQLHSLPWVWPCSAWATHNTHELCFWCRLEVSGAIHPSFTCAEVFVDFLSAQSALLKIYLVGKMLWVCFLCNDVHCFLAIPAGSGKNRIDAQGMSLMLGHAGLIHSRKRTAPRGLRVTFSSRQNPLSISLLPLLPITRVFSRLLSPVASCKLECGLHF